MQEWKCGVCHESYDRSQNYCVGCLQSLYYYCYINNQMFVTNDDSYLQLYYTQPMDDLSSCSQNSENDVLQEEKQQGVNFDWVEDLLV